MASALNDRGKLVLFCVNRDLRRAVQAKLHVAGFQPAGTATATMIHATLISDKNNAQYPNAIRPVSREIQAAADFSHSFAPARVTVIEIHRG